MKILVECSQDELDEWTISQWAELKSLLTTAIGFLPDLQVIDFNDETRTAMLLGGAVTVQPSVFEASTIKSVRQRPGWSIISWKHEQEDERKSAEFVEDIQEQASNNLEAVFHAIKIAFGVILIDWIDRERIDKEERKNENPD